MRDMGQNDSLLYIHKAKYRELPEVARVIAEGFADDDVLRAMLPGEYARERRLARKYQAVLSAGHFRSGVIDVARTSAHGPIVGVAAWDGPNAARTPKRLRLHQWLRKISTYAPWHLRTMRANQDILASHHPEFPHWYLDSIVVSEKGRGQGVGSALLEYRLKWLDKMQMPAYLEASSDRSRDLYKRHGFEVQEEIQLEGREEATAWAMVRQPQPRT